jgi:hypothetical protein
MVFIDSRPKPLRILVFFLNYEGISFGEKASIEDDLVIHSLFDAGVGVEGLELHELPVVEQHRAVHGPADLVLIVPAEPHTPCFQYDILADLIFERQINFILNFVFLDLAQKAGKQYLAHGLVGDAVLEETHRALVELLLFLTAPQAVHVTSPLTPVTHLFLLAEPEVFGGLGTNAVVGAGVLIPYVEDVVVAVRGVFECI